MTSRLCALSGQLALRSSGVTVLDGLVFLSDVNTGLWIVRYLPPTPEPQPAAGDAI